MSRSADGSLVVGTTGGRVRGRQWTSGLAFLGIPYAELPYGELRFRAPVARRPWNGIRDCVAYGSTPQRRGFAETTAIPEPSIAGEDVLSVNVFTPGVEPLSLPVLFWIHGGGFVAGSPASPWYDGAAFVRDHVVVVTVSYRLGFEGFGRLPDAPDNRGLLDLLLALNWVRDNIAEFGGDASRVTIAGQSAGAGAAMHLAVAPKAEGLFSQIIAASPAPADLTIDFAEGVTAALAAHFGVTADSAGLEAIHERDLIDAVGVGHWLDAPESLEQLLQTIKRLSAGRAGPVVDGTFLPESVEDGLAAGRSSEIPILMGATRDEFSGFVLASAHLFDGRSAIELLQGSGVPEAIASRYAAEFAGSQAASVVASSLTDRMFRRHVADWMVLRQTAIAPTFVYDFAFRSTMSGLAEHCLDVPFAWDVLGDKHVAAITGPNPPQTLAADIHSAYVGFVRNGEPGWAPARGNAPVKTWNVTSRLTDDRAYASARLLASRR